MGKKSVAAVLVVLVLVSVLWSPATFPVLGAGEGMHHSGQTEGDETWYASDNPHVIDGEFVVSENDTLVLEPGVFVRIEAKAVGFPTVLGNLIVKGTLIARGTETDPVNRGHWLFVVGEKQHGVCSGVL